MERNYLLVSLSDTQKGDIKPHIRTAVEVAPFHPEFEIDSVQFAYHQNDLNWFLVTVTWDERQFSKRGQP